MSGFIEIDPVIGSSNKVALFSTSSLIVPPFKSTE